jgi:hypothetical protein
VPDVAGPTVEPAVGAPVDHDAGADPRRDLDQAQRRHLAVPGGVLAHRGGVGVVGRQHRYSGQGGLEVLAHRVGVPAGEHRRLAGPARRRVHGSREAQSQPGQVARVETLLAEDGTHRLDDPVEDLGRPGADRDVDPVLDQDGSAQVGQGDARVRGVEGDDEDVGLGGVEGQAAPAPTTGGLPGPPLDDHPGREQRVEPLADRHAGEAGGLEHVPAGGRAPVADQVEDVARSGSHAPEDNEWTTNVDI